MESDLIQYRFVCAKVSHRLEASEDKMLRGTYGLQTEGGGASQLVLLTERCDEIKENWSIGNLRAVTF